MKISIILPAYNEEITISDTIMAFNKELPNAYIWVINNASTDSTKFKANATLLKLNAHGGVIDETSKGKGKALRRAFQQINADIYVVCDADMTYPAEFVHDLIKPIASDQADMVVGDRLSGGSYKNKNKRKFHLAGNTLVQILINKLYKSSLSDVMSGFRVMNNVFVKTYPILIDEFEIETDMTLHALDKKFRVHEIPITYKERPVGSFSKLSTFKDGLAVLITIFNITRLYKPLMFYSMIGTIFIFLGALFSLPALYDWYVYDKVHRIASATLASGLEIIGFIFLILGLMLDSIANNQRRLFELHLLSLRSSPFYVSK
jgi:glycosyltransferase involved in cell wall biosynthesis